MFTRSRRRLSDAEVHEIRELLFQQRLAPMAYKDLAVVLIGFAAAAALFRWVRGIPEKWIFSIALLFPTVVTAATAVQRWVLQIRMRKEMGQLLREGQVIEEVIESRRIAVAGHNKSVVPDVGAMEAAGFFYDLGEGRFFYFWAV